MLAYRNEGPFVALYRQAAFSYVLNEGFSVFSTGWRDISPEVWIESLKKRMGAIPRTRLARDMPKGTSFLVESQKVHSVPEGHIHGRSALAPPRCPFSSSRHP